MRPLRGLDRALLATLVPLWFCCFCLYLDTVVSGRLARLDVYVSASAGPDAYPTVRWFRPRAEEKVATLQIGDQLLQVGAVDLRGVGPVGFFARVFEQATADLQVPLTIDRGGIRQEILYPLLPITFPWKAIPLSVSFVIAGVLILRHAPGSRVARSLFVACMAYSVQWTYFFGGSPMRTYAWLIMYCCSSAVLFPATLQAVLAFPEEFVPTGAPLPQWHWLFAVLAPIALSAWIGIPFPPAFAFPAYFGLTAIFVAVVFVLLLHYYRRVGDTGQRQVKWILYGLYIGLTPVLAADAIAAVKPAFWGWHDIAVLSLIAIPGCLFIAIAKFNFLDIDRLISGTAASSLLSAVFVSDALLIEPQLVQASQYVADKTGLAPPFVEVAMVAFFLGLMALLQRPLQRWIDGVRFPERRRFALGIKRVLNDIPSCPDLHSAVTLVGAQLTALLQLENCAVYLQREASYCPVFMSGSALPVLFEVGSPLVGVLQSRTAYADVHEWRRSARAALNPETFAVLEKLRVSAAFSVGQTATPLALVCLGLKRSGDVYTPTDWRLLTAVANLMSRLFDCDTETLSPQPSVR